MTGHDREFVHSCPLCEGRVFLREAHLGTEVTCPHCGDGFTPRPIAAIRADADRRKPRRDTRGITPTSRRRRGSAPVSRYEPHPKGKLIALLGRIGVIGALCSLACFQGVPLALCAPIGLAMAWGPRKELRESGGRDSRLEGGFRLCAIATGILALAVLFWSIAIAVNVLGES